MTDSTSKKTSMATTSLVCSILGILPLLGFIFGTAGLIFGVMALRRRYKYPDEYGGEKRAIFSLIIWGMLMVAWLWALIFHPSTLLNS